MQVFRSKSERNTNQKFVFFGEINEILKRIQETKSVIGTMVINHDGIAIKSSVDSTVTAQVSIKLKTLYICFVSGRILLPSCLWCNQHFFPLQYSGLLSRFTQKAIQTVRAMDPANELNFLRVSSKNNEILIAPDENFTLVVMQESVLLRPPEKDKTEADDVSFRLRDQTLVIN